MIWARFQGKPFNTTVTQVYSPATSADQGEADHFSEDLQDPLVRLVTQSCPTLCDPLDCSPPGFLRPWDCPGKNTRMRYHALLQGILPT